MSSKECEEIQRELNILLRDLASGSNAYPFAEKYETDFPALSNPSNKYPQNHNVGVTPHQHNRFCNDVQEDKVVHPVRGPKPRFGEQLPYRLQQATQGNHTRKRDQPSRYNSQTSRNISVNKQVPARLQSQDKFATNYSHAHLVTILENKKKEKQTQASATVDERKTFSNSSKKTKNFGYMKRERKKSADHPKGGHDQKIQANIFRNALSEASGGVDGKTSSTVETTKRDRPKRLSEDKVFYETEEASCALEDNISLVSQCDAEAHPNNNISERRTIISNSDSAIRTVSNTSDMSKSPVKDKTWSLSNTDEFIRRCNKPSCNCSEESLFCTLCNFHMDDRKEFERHRKQVSHEFRKQDYLRVKHLKALSPPTCSNLTAIEELLLEVHRANVQDAEDIELRKCIIEEISNDLHSEVEKECTFHLFGSSVNGFGLKSSNINIDLEVPQGISPSKMLLKSLDALKERECKYGNIISDFSATYPSISFIDRRTKLQCEITLNNETSGKTSKLLKQYSQFDDRAQKLGAIFRIWAKICAVDQQELCSLPPHCFPMMTIYFLQQTEPPVLPVFHEITNEKDLLTHDFRGFWISRNKQTLGELWMDLLKFYATIFEYRTYVISICQKDLLCKDKKWTTRMMCIEDPYHTKRNVARSIANMQWFQYILECIRSSYEYFCTCRVPKGEILPEVIYPRSYSNDEDDDSFSVEENSIDNFLEDQDKDLQVHSVVNTIKNMDLGSQAAGSPYSWENSDAREQLSYKFEKSHLINIQPPALYCRQCQKTNHVKKNCPVDENLPELTKLPKLEKGHKEMLTDVCKDVFDFCQPSQQNIQKNNMLLHELEKHIKFVFPDAQLQLFGSSCNGFGFDDSDLDICLTFLNKNGEELDQKSIIEQLTKELHRFHKVQNVIPIPTAKVPIVKLSFIDGKEGDISLYNTLAQHNTRLLSTYCKIDERVQPLGYALKFFAKTCDICDASRGSLSSYAYILMAIFYLQQLEVPVVPVLQELYDKNNRMPERYVDSWNTWFYDDVSRLSKVWKGYGQNKQSLGELWLGLLVFYTEKFNIAEYVISIRQKAPLTRFEKLWNTRSIAIEDPFDLSHNLGAGVSRNMNIFILSAFRRGRERFGRIPPSRLDIPCLMEYFFNSAVLTGGKKPPNERGCRLCFKIGHKVKECPLRRNNRKGTFEKRNSNKPQHRNQFTERTRAERPVRNTFRTRSNQDRCDPRRAPNYTSNTQNS